MPSAIPIAVVMTSFDPGGTERQMTELVRRLDRDTWAVHLACFHARGAWFRRAAEAAASVVEFPIATFRRPSALRHMWAFANWCRATRIAVVHTTELYSNIFGLPGAALATVPVRIANRREINPDKSAAQIAMQRAAYAAAHKVVANSRAAADRLRLERVPERKIAVIPNGLDFGRFQPPNPRPKLRRVVVVANLRPEKGHDVLINASVDVLRRYPDAQFEIVGGGPELHSLLARAEALGVLHAFTFLGHRDDVPARMADGDIFALPSRSEAFPNAVLEAMAGGLPVIASGVGGIVELIEDGVTGLLVSPDDAPSLADRICRLMNDPSLASRLGNAARAEALARYSFDRMVAAFESLYLTELTHRGVLDARQPQLAAS
jgi:glycosyltransferase involved in cell wall biosynthesis